MNTEPNKDDNHYGTLDAKTKQVVSDYINELIGSDRDIEELEFQSRDGFIANSFNWGGINKIGYTSLSWVQSTGYNSGSTEFNKKLDEYIEYNLKLAKEAALELKIDTSTEDGQEKLWEIEFEHLSDDSSSILIDARFMYHGENTASFSVSLNASDAPYFRSKHCDKALEVEIEWVDAVDLEKQLDALKSKFQDLIGSLGEELF